MQGEIFQFINHFPSKEINQEREKKRAKYVHLYIHLPNPTCTFNSQLKYTFKRQKAYRVGQNRFSTLGNHHNSKKIYLTNHRKETDQQNLPQLKKILQNHISTLFYSTHVY